MQDGHGAIALHSKTAVLVAPCKMGIVVIITTCMCNKMVLVMAPCRKDMVADLKYKMVVVVDPFKMGIVAILTTRWWW